MDLDNCLFHFRAPIGRMYVDHVHDVLQTQHQFGRMLNPVLKELRTSETLPVEVEQVFTQTYKQMSKIWPEFGVHHGVRSKDWWKTVMYNCFDRLEMIDDPHKARRVRADDFDLVLIENFQEELETESGEVRVLRWDPDYHHNVVFASFNAVSDSIWGEFRTPEAYRPFVDSRGFLMWIDSHYRHPIQLGIIANTYEVYPGWVLPATRFEEFFDFIVTSREAGFSKPHPAIWDLALEKVKEVAINREQAAWTERKMKGIVPAGMPESLTKVQPGDISAMHAERQNQEAREDPSDKTKDDISESTIDVIHVGNSLWKDVMGAVAHGWKAAWLVRYDDNFEQNRPKYVEQLNATGIEKFGANGWNRYKDKVTVTHNLFDLHSQGFLW